MISINIFTSIANYIYYLQPKKYCIKKQKSKKNNLAKERPQRSTPIYKRVQKLKPSLYKPNMPISNSFRKEKDKIISKQISQQTMNSPYNKKKEIKKIIPNKLKRYYSYGISLTTPTNVKQKINIIENDVLLKKIQRLQKAQNIQEIEKNI